MKFTIWKTEIPAELKRQLTEFERQFYLAKASLDRLISSPLFSLFSIPSPTLKRTVTIPTRDVDLSERHELDPWVVLTTDLTNSSNTSPEHMDGYLLTDINGGTHSREGVLSHPGVLNIRGNAGGTDGGCILNTGALCVEGGEYCVAIFQPTGFTTRAFCIGFFNSMTSIAEPADGFYLWLNGSTAIAGKTANASTRSTTSTWTNLTVDVWYTAVIKLDATRTSVSYALYDDQGLKLWSDSLGTNIPPAAGGLYSGVKMHRTVADSATIGRIDYVSTRAGSPSRNLQRYIGNAEELFT